MQRPFTYRPPLPKDEEQTTSVGVSVLLGICGAVFLPLLALFAGARSHGDARPIGVASPELVMIGTAAFAGGTTAIYRAFNAIRSAKAGAVRWLALAFVCAASIVVVDLIACVRSYHAAAATSAKLAALSLGIAGVHAAYVAAALVAIAVVALRAARGAYGPSRHLAPQLLAKHWTFVTAAWAAIFVVVHIL